MEPWPRWINSSTLVHVSLPWCFSCSSWWCVDTAEDEEGTSGHRSPPINVSWNALVDFLVKPFSFTIAYVHPNIAGKSVGENNTQLFSWDWPGDDESTLPIHTSIVNTTIFSIMNAAIASQPDPSQNIRELWGCQKEPNGDWGPYSQKISSIFHDNTAAGWVKAVMKVNNRMLFGVIYCGQQANSTSGAQTPLRGGRSYRPLDDIFLPPHKDMIDDIWEELDVDAETQRPIPRSFRTMKTCFQRFEQKL